MNSIIMKDEDRNKWTPILLEHYKEKGLSRSDCKKKIEKVFIEAQTGWKNAPKSLDTRIRIKTGFQWRSHSNLVPKKVNTKEEENFIVEDFVENMESSFFRTMSKGEKLWWQERKIEYGKDFEFNNSSDKPLLDQLLVEELMQRRLFLDSLKNRTRDYNKKLNDSIKRVTDIQTKLGITREQRAGILNKIDGNIAEIAVNLDKKLEDLPKKMEKDLEEEMKFTFLKAQSPPENILPPKEKLEALLNLDGKLGGGTIGSEKISEINETVLKEMKDIKEEKREKREGGLPTGISIDG